MDNIDWRQLVNWIVDAVIIALVGGLFGIMFYLIQGGITRRKNLGPKVSRDFTPPPLDDFVERPAKTKEILDAFGMNDGGYEAQNVGTIIALQGAGGFGKTALARYICEMEQVKSAFPGGIIWVRLGPDKNKDWRQEVSKAIRSLGGDPPAMIEIGNAWKVLAETIGRNRCLLVVDDVWEDWILKVFLDGRGEQGSVLLTTRRKDILPKGVIQINIDAMQPNEALELLALNLEKNSQEQALQALARRLGEWPLPLKLVNGALRKRVDCGSSLVNALAWVNGELDRKRFTQLNADDDEGRKMAIEATMGVSLGLLSPEEGQCYRQLAVFPENVDVPLSVVSRLWGYARESERSLDDGEADELYLKLWNLSLLLKLDLDKNVLRLHSVVRTYLEGINLMGQLHARLVDAYATGLKEVGKWTSGPMDGYYFEWLPYHLKESGRQDSLKKLLCDFGWLVAKLEATHITAVIKDYDLAEPNAKGLQLIQGALRLSMHIPKMDIEQLSWNLLGRLTGMEVQFDEICWLLA